MNRQSWTYIDDQGAHRKINLFHSPRDGKLLIQVDGQTVVATKFAQKGGRWTFLIEEELCDIVLARRGLEFSYFFEVNRQADTPRNRAFKIRERKDFWWPIGIFFTAFLLVTGFFFRQNYLKKKVENQKITAPFIEAGTQNQLDSLVFHHKIAVATLQNNGSNIKFRFAVDPLNSTFGSFLLEKDKIGNWLLPNGFPLENNDEFLVKYWPENPQIYRIELTQPTDNQIVKYLNRAAEIQLKYHSQESKTATICLVQLAWKRTNLRGLADIFYQNTSATQNPAHNQTTYNRLLRDETFKKMRAEECWGK